MKFRTLSVLSLVLVLLLAWAALAGAQEMAPTVKVAQNDELGEFLVGPNDMTLYIFLRDEPGKSNCYDRCAQNWPPLIVEGEPVAGEGVDPALLGTTTRDDGTIQVTYNGWPLYFWINDAAPGDTTGQGVGGVWYVISPAGNPVIPPSVEVMDQEIVDGKVVVAKVVSPQDGWIVIHADKDGSFGPVIGHAPVKMGGNNENVVVKIDEEAATETLYAMLHVDEGEAGVYEFPGPDGPVIVDGKPLAPAFKATMPAPEMLPVTGGSLTEQNAPWPWAVALLALAALTGGFWMARRRNA